jgi:hypothetical protein
VEDDGGRGRVIGTLYYDLAVAYKDNNTNAIIILRSRIEKEERHKVNQERHPLYSRNKGKVITFSDKVNELNDAMEDLYFNLSDNSNENLRELKTFTAEEIIKFERRIAEKIKRENKQNK